MNTSLFICLPGVSLLFTLILSTASGPTDEKNHVPALKQAAVSNQEQMPIFKNEYNEYLGKYDLDKGVFFTLTNKEGDLMGELSGAGNIEIFPEKNIKDKFFAKAAPAQFTFGRDQKGKVVTLHIAITGKGEMKGRKVE